MNAFRPGELADLRFTGIYLTNCWDKECIRVVGRIGRFNVSSRNGQGGLKIVRYKPPEIIILEKKSSVGNG